MITQTTCYVIECDGCGTKVYDAADIDGVPHFTSLAEAEGQVVPCGEDCEASEVGFHRRDDRLLCRDCAHRADCEARGHRWSMWYPPITADNRTARFCEHCGVGEFGTAGGEA